VSPAALEPATEVETPESTAPPNGDSTQLPPLPEGVQPFPKIIGQSVAIRRVFALIQRAAASEVTVLLTGETGTGKELVARTIHEQSQRHQGPFVAVNCGAIAEHLQESEFFGHKKGAFTDAHTDRQGLFEAADSGTLFLDEIGETSLSAQVKLLRTLQEGEVRRVGENIPRPVNVRLICATNRLLDEEIAAGRFREDLYYRLYVLAVRLPPLRQRRSDIPLLVEHFLTAQATKISPAAMAQLQQHAWPGNIRELENQLASAGAMAGGDKIEPGHLWSHLQKQTEPAPPLPLQEQELELALPLKDAREQFEKRYIHAWLQKLDWDLDAVSARLDLSHSRLYELIRRHDLKEE
jgi:DNA-binding NtrC family response regulator